MPTTQIKKRFVLLLTFFGAFILATGIALTSAAENLITRNLTKIELQNEVEKANQTGKTLEINFSDLEDKINLMALNPDIKSGTPEACSRASKELTDLVHSKLSNFGRIPLNRVIDCAATNDSIGTNTTGIPSVDEVFSRQKLTLGRIKFSTIYQKYLFSLHTPLFNKNGKFIGTVGGTIYLDDLRSYYLVPLGLYNSSFLVLIDDNGDILNHPDSSLIGKNLLNEPGADKRLVEVFKKTLARETPEEQKIDKGENEPYLTSSVSEIFPGRKWVVISLIPKAQISKRVSAGLRVHGQYSAFFYLRIGTIITISATVLAVLFYSLRKLFVLPPTDSPLK